MKRNKTLIIVIIIIAVLAVCGTVFGYLFMATDVFRSDKELFAKYMSQNTEKLKQVLDLQTLDIYGNLKNEQKYDSKTKIKLLYSEGGEVSNPINNLSAKVNIQKDEENEYFYLDGQILYSEEEYFTTQLIKQEELYGLGFPDVVKQFITVRDDENLQTVATDIGIESEQLKNVIEIINGTKTITKTVSENILSEEEQETLKQKYMQIITDNISKGTFDSLKNAMITYNDETVKTNAYTVSLGSEQVKQLLIQILNNLKEEELLKEENDQEENYQEEIKEIEESLNEEEIPAIKITVYEQKQNTIRTIIEVGTYKITLEHKNQNGQINAIIQMSDLSAEEIYESIIQITKKNEENKELLNMELQTVEGEEEITIAFTNESQKIQDTVECNSSITIKKDILEIGIQLENTVSVNTEFEKKYKLESSNNIILNDLEKERRTYILDLLKQKVPEKAMTRIMLLGTKLGLIGNEIEDNNSTENQISQVDVNQFNAKFEFYTGDNVSSGNVKSLLDVAKNNLAGYAMTSSENETKQKIQLNIEKGIVNEESVNQVLEQIKDESKYKVQVSYKQDNGMIEYVTIEEVD